jgi:hypothetical protein
MQPRLACLTHNPNFLSRCFSRGLPVPRTHHTTQSKSGQKRDRWGPACGERACERGGGWRDSGSGAKRTQPAVRVAGNWPHRLTRPQRSLDERLKDLQELRRVALWRVLGGGDSVPALWWVSKGRERSSVRASGFHCAVGLSARAGDRPAEKRAAQAAYPRRVGVQTRLRVGKRKPTSGANGEPRLAVFLDDGLRGARKPARCPGPGVGSQGGVPYCGTPTELKLLFCRPSGYWRCAAERRAKILFGWLLAPKSAPL